MSEYALSMPGSQIQKQETRCVYSFKGKHAAFEGPCSEDGNGRQPFPCVWNPVHQCADLDLEKCP